jgi:hypothetical protein
MTDSTPSETEPAKQTASAAEGTKETVAQSIPKARFDQVNNKLKDAQKQLAELQARIAGAGNAPAEQQAPATENPMSNEVLMQAAEKVASEIVEQRTAALRQELDFKDRVMGAGLSSDQAKLVQENQTKWGMDFDTALNVARGLNPKAFTQLVRNSPFDGQARVTGPSPLRNGEPKVDLLAQANKARAAGIVDEGVEGSSFELAAEALRQRIARGMQRIGRL